MRGATGYQGPIIVTTERLILRPWRLEDLPRLAEMNPVFRS